MDTGGCFLERHSRVVELVATHPSTLSMVVMYDTKLDIKISRRDTMWPNYRMIRNDELGDGVLLQFQDKQKVSVIGVINAIKETEDELLNYLTQCFVVV